MPIEKLFIERMFVMQDFYPFESLDTELNFKIK